MYAPIATQEVTMSSHSRRLTLPLVTALLALVLSAPAAPAIATGNTSAEPSAAQLPHRRPHPRPERSRSPPTRTHRQPHGPSLARRLGPRTPSRSARPAPSTLPRTETASTGPPSYSALPAACSPSQASPPSRVATAASSARASPRSHHRARGCRPPRPRRAGTSVSTRALTAV